jgi:hypothetical protein
VLPLEYRSEAPPPSGFAIAARVVVGFVGYIVLSVGWVRFALRSRVTPVAIVVVWVAMTAGLLWLAMYLRTRHGRVGYGYGILLVLLMALGLVLLIIGICWH